MNDDGHLTVCACSLILPNEVVEAEQVMSSVRLRIEKYSATFSYIPPSKVCYMNRYHHYRHIINMAGTIYTYLDNVL